jgi:hypothetical protein
VDVGHVCHAVHARAGLNVDLQEFERWMGGAARVCGGAGRGG